MGQPTQTLIEDADYLVAAGWAPNREQAIARAVHALAAAQRLINGAASAGQQEA